MISKIKFKLLVFQHTNLNLLLILKLKDIVPSSQVLKLNLFPKKNHKSLKMILRMIFLLMISDYPHRKYYIPNLILKPNLTSKLKALLMKVGLFQLLIDLLVWYYLVGRLMVSYPIFKYLVLIRFKIWKMSIGKKL